MWKRFITLRPSYNAWALFVGVVGVAVGIYAVPDVQSYFNEDERSTIQKLGYSWSKTGFAEAWQQHDEAALQAFMDGGFVVDNEVFFSILRDGDVSAPLFMSFDENQISLIANKITLTPDACKVSQDDIMEESHSWLDSMISDCRRASFYISSCAPNMRFEDSFEYDQIRRNLLQLDSSYRDAGEHIDLVSQFYRINFLSEIPENAADVRCPSSGAR